MKEIKTLYKQQVEIKNSERRPRYDVGGAKKMRGKNNMSQR